MSQPQHVPSVVHNGVRLVTQPRRFDGGTPHNRVSLKLQLGEGGRGMQCIKLVNRPINCVVDDSLKDKLSLVEDSAVEDRKRTTP